jgi:hypothetical protein
VRKTGKILNNVRERLKNSQQKCEILTNVRFSRMRERLEKFSTRI